MNPAELAVHEPDLRARASRSARCEADIDDLVQETFLRALCSRAAGARNGRLYGYLARTLDRLVLARGRRRPVLQPDDDCPDVVIMGEPDLGVDDRLARAMAGLHPSRLVLLQLRAQGLTHREAAERLGLPEHVAQQRFARTAQGLRRLLGGRP